MAVSPSEPGQALLATPAEPNGEPDAEAIPRRRSRPGKAPERFFVILFQTAEDPNTMLNGACTYRIMRELESTVTTPKSRTEIDLWLESPGGDAHAAFKLMLALRASANRIRVVVPDYAKSAATLVAIGADEIYMAPTAELGPLDAQVYDEEHGNPISALSIARSVEHLGQTAFSMALYGGGAIVSTTGLSRKDTLTASLDFVAELMQPIVSKLDPSQIHRASSQLRVASEYAERLLLMRRKDIKERVNENLAEHLVENFPDHGFVISLDEARRAGLPIREAADYSHWDKAHAMFDAWEGTRRTLIQVLPEAGLPQDTENDDAASPNEAEGGES